MLTAASNSVQFNASGVTLRQCRATLVGGAGVAQFKHGMRLSCRTFVHEPMTSALFVAVVVARFHQASSDPEQAHANHACHVFLRGKLEDEEA